MRKSTFDILNLKRERKNWGKKKRWEKREARWINKNDASHYEHDDLLLQTPYVWAKTIQIKFNCINIWFQCCWRVLYYVLNSILLLLISLLCPILNTLYAISFQLPIHMNENMPNIFIIYFIHHIHWKEYATNKTAKSDYSPIWLFIRISTFKRWKIIECII